jgi:hypothetical protein
MNIRLLKIMMLATDIGFIVYWLITIAHVIPADMLFRDYSNPILIHWNWSFLPLDIFISATGISSLLLMNRNNSAWRQLAIVSLTLTFVSGLQAIAFWAIAGDFDIWWWGPNLFLMLYPVVFLPKLIPRSRLINFLYISKAPVSTWFHLRSHWRTMRSFNLFQIEKFHKNMGLFFCLHNLLARVQVLSGGNDCNIGMDIL